jgi:N-methylhydantoinase A
MALYPELAATAIRERVAQALFSGDVMAAAAGIRQVIDSQMADLIRKSTLERGYDAREFVMMAYGGAGPVHAASYGEQVGVREVIVPFFATVHSAYGAALSDVRFSLQHSHPLVLPAAPAVVENIYAAMEADGMQRLAEAEVPEASRRFERWVEARFRRQVHHLRVPAPARIDSAGLDTIAADFEAEYERLFGKGAALRDAGIELVNYGVDAIGATPKLAAQFESPGAQAAAASERMTFCPRRKDMVKTPVYDGPGLPVGARLAGPAIIEHPGTTIVVLSGQNAHIDHFRHTHITL